MTENPPEHRRSALGMFASLPPHQHLLVFTVMKAAARAVWVLAKLGVADHLADGPRPVAEVADAVGAHRDALLRVLRCAAAFGVFALLPDGRAALTPAAEQMRTDIPGSMRDMVLLHGDDTIWRPYGEIMHTMRTGEPAFDHVFGTSFFAHLNRNPEVSAVFRRAMTGANKGNPALLTGLVDLAPFRSVADIGGGEGAFLIELLTRYTHCTGALVERADAVDAAAAMFDKRGVADRATTIRGDFFAAVPSGYEAYVLKQVLHDWNDDDAVRILRNVRTAIGTAREARLFIVERLVGTGGPTDIVALLDVDMLVVFGGRERSLDEWRGLVGDSGFDVVAAPAQGPWTAIECRPR